MNNKPTQTPIILEFFGLPGSGKTTIALLLKDRLQDAGYDTAAKPGLANWVQQTPLLKKTSLLFSHPIYTLRGLSVLSPWFLTSFDNSMDNKMLFRWLTSSLYLDAFVKNQTPNICILDQWSVQMLWSAFYEQNLPGQELFNRYISYAEAFLPRKYIFFKLRPEVASLRIVNRKNGDSRLDGLKPDVVTQKLLVSEALINKLAEALNQNDCDVLFVNAEDHPESIVNQILKQIMP